MASPTFCYSASERLGSRRPDARLGRAAGAQDETAALSRKEKSRRLVGMCGALLPWTNLSSGRHTAREPAGCSFPRMQPSSPVRSSRPRGTNLSCRAARSARACWLLFSEYPGVSACRHHMPARDDLRASRTTMRFTVASVGDCGGLDGGAVTPAGRPTQSSPWSLAAGRWLRGEWAHGLVPGLRGPL